MSIDKKGPNTQKLNKDYRTELIYEKCLLCGKVGCIGDCISTRTLEILGLEKQKQRSDILGLKRQILELLNGLDLINIKGEEIIELGEEIIKYGLTVRLFENLIKGIEMTNIKKIHFKFHKEEEEKNKKILTSREISTELEYSRELLSLSIESFKKILKEIPGENIIEQGIALNRIGYRIKFLEKIDLGN